MINQRTETTDELFDRIAEGNKKISKKQKKATKKAKKNKNKKDRKTRLVAAIVAGILAGTAALSAMTYGISKLFGKNKNNVPKTSKTSVVDTVDLDEMGTSLDFVEDDKMDQPKYGKTTGNVDASKVVTSTDSKGKTTYYKDQKAKDNAKNIGKKETDTKNGTLVVDSNGTVKEKTPGYTYVDPKTNQTVTGEGEKPKGYTEDSAFEGLIPEEETNKYVKLDKDLKDPETGEILFAKGDRIEKTTLAKYEEYVRLYNSQKQNQKSTSSSKTVTQSSTEQTNSTKTTTEQTTSTTGKTNANGTYTFDGVTYKDYNTFLGLADNEDFVSVNGILWLKSEVDAMNNQKTK